MNANANVFIPFASRMMELMNAPFFQQRLERFLFQEYRSENGSMKDISILAQGAEVGTIKPLKKKEVIFLGTYKGHVIVYEADRMADPRTGHFRTLVQTLPHKTFNKFHVTLFKNPEKDEQYNLPMSMQNDITYFNYTKPGITVCMEPKYHLIDRSILRRLRSVPTDVTWDE